MTSYRIFNYSSVDLYILGLQKTDLRRAWSKVAGCKADRKVFIAYWSDSRRLNQDYVVCNTESCRKWTRQLSAVKLESVHGSSVVATVLTKPRW